MKPSERIKELYKHLKHIKEPNTNEMITDYYLSAIIDYLDEEYARTEKNHCDCHACPNKK